MESEQVHTANEIALLNNLTDNYDSLRYCLLKAQTFDIKSYGFPTIYYKIMETDKQRVQSFVDAFEKYNWLKDSVVCEIGCGRFALTDHYLNHCKKAYLIESNPAVYDFIEEKLRKNNWQDKVVVIRGDVMKINELPEKVDFVIGELMSVFCANQHQVPIFKHARKWLNENGKLLPEKIKNFIQVGYTYFDSEHKFYPLMFTRHWPALLTTKVLVNVIDLYTVDEMTVNVIVKVKAVLSGKVNCVLLNSYVQVAEGCNFTGTDSLMQHTVVKLDNKTPFIMKEDQEYQLKIKFTYATTIDEASFEIIE
ncbi:unnamed protein product [Adineta steineri]|uniref:PRMT5 arginine-N-methyltransferase domain-containing protein n=1 Tax=Adineta steineri TaxID=433720 RepID=A0A819IXL9_9BILA|nr:unnamed protein product [Adineta steineri]CAF3924356.1 unnamed protein product [Adineta steineri]